MKLWKERRDGEVCESNSRPSAKTKPSYRELTMSKIEQFLYPLIYFPTANYACSARQKSSIKILFFTSAFYTMFNSKPPSTSLDKLR